MISSSFLPPRVVASGLTMVCAILCTCQHRRKSVSSPGALILIVARSETGIRCLSQLLSTHHVSISLLQLKVMLPGFRQMGGRLREFVHEKSSLKKTPLRPYCARIV